MPADDLTGGHVSLVAQSVVARRVSGSAIPQWTDAFLVHPPDNRLTSDVLALGVASNPRSTHSEGNTARRPAPVRDQ
jgi:hypothetical protein